MHGERGQVTVVAAAVIGVVMVGVIGLAMIGEAMITRAQATVAADAVALAEVEGDGAAQVLGSWYRDRGVTIEVESVDTDRSDVRVVATVGDAVARSRAVSGQVGVAPALVAVVARAEQLVGQTLLPVEIDAALVSFSGLDAVWFESVAAELGMCVAVGAAGVSTYRLCGRSPL